MSGVSEQPQPFLTRGLVVAVLFAVAGATVIGFVFVPLLSPGTDTVNAFLGTLGFMTIVMAAGYAARSQR